MIKKVFLFTLINIKLFAASHSFILENDAMAGTDRHYTNGFFYTWMSEDNDEDIPNWLNLEKIAVDNMAVSFTHLTFTPEDLSDPNVITDDMPYAGYINLNFFLYQSMQNFFHEVGVGLGAVGPIAQSDDLQKFIHKSTGNRQPQGWNNQLRTEYLLNASYQFAYKTDKRNLGFLEYDWTNNARIDLGEFYSGALVGTSIRFGSYVPDNFKTSGNFIGGEESSLLNFGNCKGLGWSVSLGLFANAIKRFYVVDEYEEYQIESIDYTRGRVLTFNIYYDNFEFALKLKSTKFESNDNLNGLNEDIQDLSQDSIREWGGLSFRWKFDEDNKKVPTKLEENNLDIEALKEDEEAVILQ